MNWRALEWVVKPEGWMRVAFVGTAVFAASQTIPACSTSPNSAINGSGDSPTPPVTTTTTTSDSCDHPNPGCACSQAGETGKCGTVIARQGDFYQCSEGKTTCDGRTWGTCEGDITVDVNAHVISGGGVSLRGYGLAMSCGASNPCDPYCQKVVDTPIGIDGGTTLATSDAGLTIAQVGTPPNYCQEPATSSSTLSNLFAGTTSFTNGSSSTTIACTGGGTTTDTCPFDSACTGAGGTTCAAIAQGTTLAGCSGAADFTVGLGCWDSGASLTGLELEVCNRGGQAANSGTLQIDLSTTPPTGRPTGCGGDTFPDVYTTAPASYGYCTINLGTAALAAGECTSFNLANPMTNGVACTLTNLTFTAGSEIAAVVNPPMGTTFNPSATPLAECDVCNNYTAIRANSAGQAYDACTQSLCGTPGGSGMGGMGSCTTTITGTVMDPGLNVGLSNIEVYIPTAAPHAFTDPVGGSTPPPCDTCSTLNDPFTLGVVTNASGVFTLNIPGGTAGSTINLPYGLVIQTGRWRRLIPSFSVSACNTTNLNPVVGGHPNYAATSLPKCRTGNAAAGCGGVTGDIPKMAIVTADQESLECWLLQVGIDKSEINAYMGGGVSGDTSRISLYVDNGASTVSNGVQTNQTIPSYTTGSAATYALLSSAAEPNNATINQYTVVLWPCDGGQFTPNSQEVAEMAAFSNAAGAGGRQFMNHFSGEDWIQNGVGAWNGVAATWPDNDNPTKPAQGVVLNGATSPDQQSFYGWVGQWDNTQSGYTPIPPEWISSVQPRATMGLPNTAFTALVMGQTSNNWTYTAPTAPTNYNYTLSGWFNTPVGAGAGNYCGRVVFNDMHVSSTRASYSGNPGGTFPTGCDVGTPTTAQMTSGTLPALTSEELALEYEFFEVSACNLGVSIPIPPPAPPTPLTTTTFTRTFQASCSPGYGIKWGFFEWEGTAPPGTSFSFSAQTSPTGNPGSYVPATPVVLEMNTTMASTSAWNASGSVDTALTAAGQSSQEFLEVQMTLNPNSTGTVAPTLTSWEQLYDCIP